MPPYITPISVSIGRREDGRAGGYADSSMMAVGRINLPAFTLFSLIKLMFTGATVLAAHTAC